MNMNISFTMFANNLFSRLSDIYIFVWLIFIKLYTQCHSNSNELCDFIYHPVNVVIIFVTNRNISNFYFYNPVFTIYKWQNYKR